VSVPGQDALVSNAPVQDNARLTAELWRRRSRNSADDDYPLGPGDVIQVTVPGVDALKDQTVRISGDDILALPLVGSIKLDNMTESQLRAELLRRLSVFMRHPELDLFVRTYRSRQVAVMGAVERPGLYDLANSEETLLGAISQAGGVRPDAARYLLLIPARTTPQDPVGGQNLGHSTPGSGSQALAAAYEGQPYGAPIAIALEGTNKGITPVTLAIPARPGDVIMVPAAGQVMVEGWVEKPGNYQISHGLTVLGAIGAAGGVLYAAADRATITRVNSRGQQTTSVDLDALRQGREADIPVQDGDVIDVPYSAVKMVPYGIASILGRSFYLGASLPIF
jgi:polysaccharide export outer membrane protein